MKTLEVFLAHAVTVEEEAADRYDELAAAMEVHHNEDVAALFRRMAGYSRRHLAEATERAQRAGGLPELKPWEYQWGTGESPESGPVEASHYLMTPHHALQLAMKAERGARDFYAGVAGRVDDPVIRAAAEEFAEEEAEHVAELERWLERYPEPRPGWDEDLDPPVSVD